MRQVATYPRTLATSLYGYVVLHNGCIATSGFADGATMFVQQTITGRRTAAWNLQWRQVAALAGAVRPKKNHRKLKIIAIYGNLQ